MTGSNPKAPIVSAAELEAELIVAVQADAKGKIAPRGREAA